MKQIVTRETMHHYHQDQQKHLTPATATIPLVINGYDKVMGERCGSTIRFMNPGLGIIMKVEQKTDKGYIELTLGARIGIGPLGSTYMVEQWQSNGIINFGSPAPDWAQAMVPQHIRITKQSVAVGSAVGCPHQWEQKPLFTGHYHKCLLCGEEKQ